MFTVDPAPRDLTPIEAAFGLGEVVVSGRVEPDLHHVDRETLSDARIGRQSVRIATGPDGDNVDDCVTPASTRVAACSAAPATSVLTSGSGRHRRRKDQSPIRTIAAGRSPTTCWRST